MYGRKILVKSGRVQGVGFSKILQEIPPSVWVIIFFFFFLIPINLRDGRVFCHLPKADPEAVKLFIKRNSGKGPLFLFAHVEDVDVTFREAFGNVYQFMIFSLDFLIFSVRLFI